jgi:hypothetical protein
MKYTRCSERFNEGKDKDPTILLPLSLGESADDFDDFPYRIVGGNNFQLYPLNEIRHAFSAAIDHGVALLAAMAEKGAHHEIIDPYFSQGGSDLIQFDWLYDGFYKFH